MRPGVLNEQGVVIRGIPHYARDQDYADNSGAEGWYLRLALAFGLDINDNRDKLPPVEGGYAVRLLVGADDGAARAFEVDIDWDGDPNLKPDEVLATTLDHLHVREV